MQASQKLNGLILAGGYSRRMGTDKGLLVYHGKPQREFLFELLGKFCTKVFTSCRKEQRIPTDLNPIVDKFHFPGPLNGILSAFRHESSAWLTVAVDMPFVNGSALEALLSHRDRSKVATCFYNPETQQPEPLLTLWESEAFPLLSAFAEGSNVSPREFLKTHPVKMVDPPDQKILLNVNDPDEFKKINTKTRRN